MTHIKQTCLQGLADLERMEWPWLESITEGEPEIAAITLRMLLAHLTDTDNRNRLKSAMAQIHQGASFTPWVFNKHRADTRRVICLRNHVHDSLQSSSNKAIDGVHSLTVENHLKY